MLFQTAQLRNSEWESHLDDDLQQQWRRIQSDFQAATTREMTRFIADVDNETNEYELHIFADASARAYAAVAYICVLSSASKWSETHLIFPKSRIIKPDLLTIPKLELLALILAGRILCFLRDALPLTYKKTILWSDSKCALSWIKTHKILPTFIQRHVDELRTIEDVQFRYLVTTDNPADIPSRGASLKDLEQSIWWSGPLWINSESDWPVNEFKILDEIHIIDPISSEKTLMIAIQRQYHAPFDIVSERYNYYLKLLRVTAAAISFLGKFSISNELQTLWVIDAHFLARSFFG